MRLNSSSKLDRVRHAGNDGRAVAHYAIDDADRESQRDGLISTIVHGVIVGGSHGVVGDMDATVPVGAQMGDLLIAVVTTQAASAITATGGRRSARRRAGRAGGNSRCIVASWRSAMWELQHHTRHQHAGAWAVSAYSGVNTSSTIEAVGSKLTPAPPARCAPVTPIASADMLLYVGAYNASSASMAAPASMTERVDTCLRGGFSTVYVACSCCAEALWRNWHAHWHPSGSNDSVMG